MSMSNVADMEGAQQSSLPIDSDDLGEELCPRMLQRWTLQGIEHDHECDQEDTPFIDDAAVTRTIAKAIARFRDRENFCALFARDAKFFIWAMPFLMLVLLPWFDWAFVILVGLVALPLFYILVFHCSLRFHRRALLEREGRIEMSECPVSEAISA
jgi:hypothetical protein